MHDNIIDFEIYFENAGLLLKIFENQTLRKFPAIRIQ